MPSPVQDKKRLLYVSSLPCVPTSGGPLQIYRHFRERSDYTFIDLGLGAQNVWEQWIGPRWSREPAFDRIRRTRLYPLLLAAAYGTGHKRAAKGLVRRLGAQRADAIVTVAYGRLAFVARYVAQLLQLPLIAFFHDWWPDLPTGISPHLRLWL